MRIKNTIYSRIVVGFLLLDIIYNDMSIISVNIIYQDRRVKSMTVSVTVRGLQEKESQTIFNINKKSCTQPSIITFGPTI